MYLHGAMPCAVFPRLAFVLSAPLRQAGLACFAPGTKPKRLERFSTVQAATKYHGPIKMETAQSHLEPQGIKVLISVGMVGGRVGGGWVGAEVGGGWVGAEVGGASIRAGWVGSSCRGRRVAVGGRGVDVAVRVGDADGGTVGELVRVGTYVAVGVEVIRMVDVEEGTAASVCAAVTVGVVDASPVVARTIFGSGRF